MKLPIFEGSTNCLPDYLNQILRRLWRQENQCAGPPEGPRHRQNVLFELGAGESPDLGQTGKYRRTTSFGNLEYGVEICDFFVFLRHRFLFERSRSAVDFTSLQGYIQFSARIANDESRFSEIQMPGEEPAADELHWTHRLAANSEPGALAQLFQTVNAQCFPGDKDIVIFAERRSEIDKLGGIKINASHSQTALARIPGELAPIVSP